ncbi:hypothetical protein [Haloferula sp.]|uniref:hypothetical protein n=1 Tax=Haloferula sp. TaxID=2497595 RepID=UPI0032A0283A
MNLRSTLTTSALAVSGLGLTWFAGDKLQEKGNFDYRPNPLGLKASPYGQVIAMAIQTPIDADWHGGLEVHGLPDEDGEHDHGDCAHEDHHSEPPADEPPATLLTKLSTAVKKRTNPNPPTLGHQLYLRREIEKKLRFAYELDPSHYANYNTYHLFLVEPELGTSKETAMLVRTHAVYLAEQTIRYCLRETNDPRPALTAAAAAYNILETKFIEVGEHSTADMRKQLSVMDFCLKRHFEMLEESIENENWSRLSDMRQSEILERSRFSLKLREAAEKTIVRLESAESSTASHDPS